MDKTKLKEEELNEVTPAQAQPIPATTEEVAAATPAAEPVEVVATPQAAASDSPAADPLVPPVEGMVPTGWAFPNDLAAAVAMATGDVEAAETAADATVTEEPLVMEEPAEDVAPVEVTPQEAPVEPAPAEENTLEEKIYSRKSRLHEEEEEGLPVIEDDIITGEDDFEDVEVEDGEIPMEDLDSADISDILNSLSSYFTVEDEIEDEIPSDDDFDAEDGIEIEDDEVECEGEECEEPKSASSLAGTFSDLSKLLSDFDDDIIFEDEEDAPEFTKEELGNAVDFVTSFNDDLFADEDDFEAEMEEDIVDNFSDVDAEDIEIEEVEEEEEPVETYSAIKEAAASIKYPAGSSPKNSAIVSGVPAEESIEPVEIEDDFDVDLVRSYEAKSRVRRESFKEFRKNLIQKRRENSRFNEALNTTSASAVSGNKDAWSNNTFMSKYNESKKLNWAELFEKGILG